MIIAVTAKERTVKKMKLDINKLLNSRENIAILILFKNTKFYDLIKLLNKYGISGLDTINFLEELKQIIEKSELTNNKEFE